MKTIREIIIYGSGQRGRGLYTLLKDCGINIKHVIDTSEKKWGSPFYDTQISKPDVLLQDGNTPICIAIAKEEDAMQVRKRLWEEYAVAKEREIRYFDLIRDLYQINEKIQCALREEISLGQPEIIFECDYGLGLGGIEAWTKSICGELAAAGRGNIQIISDTGDYDIPPILKDKVVMLPINHDEMFGAETIISIVRFLMGQLPCVVVTGQFYVTLLAACLIKQHYPYQIRIISTIHFGQEDLYRQYASVNSCIERFIGVSREITEGLERYGVAGQKIGHMTCPVECEEVLRRSYTTDEAYPVRIGFAGRVNAKQKRMDLVPALVRELNIRKVNYCLEIAGEGNYSEKLETFIKNNRLGDRIRLLGRVNREDISGFWKRQDICLSLSDYEGRSISMMEAMANGAVPVVTETSGVREEIKDGENGYIAAIQDVGKLAERIAFLESHRERLEIMGKKAHDEICPKCQMRDHLRYWEVILDSKTENMFLHC